MSFIGQGNLLKLKIFFPFYHVNIPSFLLDDSLLEDDTIITLDLFKECKRRQFVWSVFLFWCAYQSKVCSISLLKLKDLTKIQFKPWMFKTSPKIWLIFFYFTQYEIICNSNFTVCEWSCSCWHIFCSLFFSCLNLTCLCYT